MASAVTDLSVSVQHLAGQHIMSWQIRPAQLETGKGEKQRGRAYTESLFLLKSHTQVLNSLSEMFTPRPLGES